MCRFLFNEISVLVNVRYQGEAPQKVREAVCAFANDLAGHGKAGAGIAIARKALGDRLRFEVQGGVGKTSLVYHCAFMFAQQGKRVLAVDLDPQSNLSIMALDEERLEEFWPDYDHARTLSGAVAPLFAGTGDIRPAHIELLDERLGLLVGDLALSRIEDDSSTEWPRCLEGRERAFQVTTAFWRAIEEASKRHEADVALIDVGPNLGAINRAALVASSHVIMPVAPCRKETCIR